MWGRVLGSVQGGTNKCVRQTGKESGEICTSYEQSELGNFGVVEKVITHMCSLQSVLWGTRMIGEVKWGAVQGKGRECVFVEKVYRSRK